MSAKKRITQAMRENEKTLGCLRQERKEALMKVKHIDCTIEKLRCVTDFLRLSAELHERIKNCSTLEQAKMESEAFLERIESLLEDEKDLGGFLEDIGDKEEECDKNENEGDGDEILVV